MRRRTWLVWGPALVAAALPAAPAAAAAKPAKLKAFASCNSLVRYGAAHLDRVDGQVWSGVRPIPLPAPRPVAMEDTAGTAPAPAPLAAAPERAGQDFSQTNTQEAGVDEPDVVKTDGRVLYALQGSKLHAVDVRAEQPVKLGTLDLGQASGSGGELLLHGDRLLVIGTAFTLPGPRAASTAAPAPGQSRTVLTEVDVSDPKAMKVARTLGVDGDYAGARLNGATARVVVTSRPQAFAEPEAAASPPGFIPRASFRSRITSRRFVRAAVRCQEVRRPATFSGLSMISVLTIDLDRGLFSVDSDGVMGDAQHVYGSPSSLYVATQRWIDPDTSRPPEAPGTTIHRFDASAKQTTEYRGSGSVSGYLLNQFALSEHDGVLRAATTEQPQWFGGEQLRSSESAVTTLRVGASSLPQIGRVGGLGKGERIYSVRFLGDVGYVVTFRQVDPLYTVALGDPAAPKVLGELKITGYSAYLHPIADDLLLGVGQDASEEGRIQGSQVSLFDVSDLRAPKLLAKASVGDPSSSTAEYDHRAFLFWAPRNLAVMPLELYGRNGSEFRGAVGYRVSRAGIAEVGRASHPPQEGFAPPISRAVVVGERVFTLSHAGLQAGRIADLGALSFLPLS